MIAKATANIGFEKKIWDAACVLRGNMDASEYKTVVLGLIFLKYISDRFEEKYQQLVEEGDGFEEDVDEYISEGIFFVPENARWNVIASKAHTAEIGTVIDEAMRAIEKENKRLKDILPKNFARPELDKRRLGEVVDLFTNIKMVDSGNSKDVLGRTYEYCLSKFAEQEGKLAGEFYTPSCVVRTLVEVLQPYNGRVYDPCCGSGGMFVQSAKFIENHSGNINNISVFGQDSNPTTWKLAQMNLAIRGIEANLGSYNADTFFNDCHPTLRADFIISDLTFISAFVKNTQEEKIRNVTDCRIQSRSLAANEETIADLKMLNLSQRVSDREIKYYENVEFVFEFSCEDEKYNKHYFRAVLKIPNTKDFVKDYWKVEKVG